MKDILHRIFVDLQKAFDTILSVKFNHYGVCSISNNWFRYYLSNQHHYISINGYDSCLTKINWVPQGPLYIFDIYQ